MANTYTLIASQTLASATAAITFSSIPSTYTDLVIKFSGRSSTDTPICYGAVRFNSDTASNYVWKSVYGTGTAASSTGNTTGYFPYMVIGASNATANTFGNSEIYIPNYAGSTNKSVSIDAVSENNGTTANQVMLAGIWNSTAAINTISLTEAVATFTANTTAYLYGIKNS